MENIKIAIVSADGAYRKALSMSLLAVCSEFIIRNFDCRQFVSESSSYEGEGSYCDVFDIVLWDGTEMDGSIYGNLVQLTPKASSVKMDFIDKRFYIYKYSSAHSMIAAIFDIYSNLTGRNAVYVHKEKVNLFAFGSWTGGSGCSTAALGVAQELKRWMGKRVLYISLETVESAGAMFQTAPGLKTISEYLYRVLGDRPYCDSEEQLPFLDSYMMRDLYGIETFAPSKGKNPLPELSEYNMQRFLASLIDRGRYDTIVADMGCCLSEAALATMQMAQRICFIATGTEMTLREEMYLSHVICCTGERTEEKSIRVLNRSAEPERTSDEGKKGTLKEHIIQRHIKLGSFPNMDGNVEPRQLILEGDFGLAISNLTAAMID